MSAENNQNGAPSGAGDMITEDEASLYDRQIRLWGLEAQNRMRSSTILILTLRSLSQETIKNLVLAGVGRLIVMDDRIVSEEDLGAGLLFREGEGAVGMTRVEAALPQIRSLNPLVSITPLSTLHPFCSPSSSSSSSFSSTPASTSVNRMEVDVDVDVNSGSSTSNAGNANTNGAGSQQEMEDFLVREKVDLVCATDLGREEMVKINNACRATHKLFYGAGSYGFLGYLFADLGREFEWVMATGSLTGSGQAGTANANIKMSKKLVDCPTLGEALSVTASPFKGLTKNQTKDKLPGLVLGIRAVWEYQATHNGSLPTGEEGTEEKLKKIAEGLRKDWAINEKFMKEVDGEMISHLAHASPHEFAPTAAILGGLLAQDILKALSRKEKPVMNFMAVDTMGGNAATTRWGMGEERET